MLRALLGDGSPRGRGAAVQPRRATACPLLRVWDADATATAALSLRDENAERRVLSGMLHQPDLSGFALMDLLTVDDLGFDHHRRVWAACWSVWDGKAGELELVELYYRLLPACQSFPGANVAGWLAELWCEDGTGAECVYHAVRVRDLARRRGAIHAANEMVRDAIG
jgi:replicative DNA helicase